MTALLDTSVVIGRTPPNVSPWAVSVVTVGELRAGVLLAQGADTRAARLRRLTETLARAKVISIDGAVAASYGELRNAAGRGPSNDLWIAATALTHDLTLVTADHSQAALPLVRTQLVQ